MSTKEELMVSEPKDIAQVVTIETLPVINERIKEVGLQVSERIKILGIGDIEATEENLKEIKGLHAQLNKEFKEFDSQRIAVSKKLREPLTDMEGVFKEHLTTPYKEGINLLKNKRDVIIQEILLKKEADLSVVFSDYMKSQSIDFIDWKKYKEVESVIINISTTEKKYIEAISQYTEKIVSDLELIEMEEFKAEILVQYKKSLNCSESIINVKKRKEEERKEQERLQAIELENRLIAITDLGFVLSEDKTLCVYEKYDLKFNWSEAATATERDFQKLLTEKKALINASKVSQASAEIKEQKETPIESPVVAEEVVAPVDPITAPTVEKPIAETYVFEFRITDTLENAKKVKQFMVDNNINFEDIE